MKDRNGCVLTVGAKVFTIRQVNHPDMVVGHIRLVNDNPPDGDRPYCCVLIENTGGSYRRFEDEVVVIQEGEYELHPLLF